MPKSRNPLTVKQKKFVKEYIKTGNGVQSVLEAGYKTTPLVARSIASENLAKPNIKERIDRALEALDITPEYTLSGFKSLHEDNRKKNPMVSTRTLENLADISQMYPNKNTSLELSDGKLSISWEQ